VVSNFIFSFLPIVILLCGHPNRPHYGSCPSVRPSVPDGLLTQTKRRRKKVKVDVNVTKSRSNRCVILAQKVKTHCHRIVFKTSSKWRIISRMVFTCVGLERGRLRPLQTGCGAWSRRVHGLVHNLMDGRTYVGT